MRLIFRPNVSLYDTAAKYQSIMMYVQQKKKVIFKVAHFLFQINLAHFFPKNLTITLIKQFLSIFFFLSSSFRRNKDIADRDREALLRPPMDDNLS